MLYPEVLSNAISSFKKLPGIGEKTAERFVYALYEKDMDEVENLAESLVEFKIDEATGKYKVEEVSLKLLA